MRASANSVFESQLGVADPPLVDYLSDLMLRFARLDTVHRVRNLAGRPVVEVADMLSEAESRIGLARRDVHRHIGDVTLFWTGVYPESLPQAAGRREEGLLRRLLQRRASGPTTSPARSRPTATKTRRTHCCSG